MFSPLTVLLAILIYMSLLFLLALKVEREAAAGRNRGNNPFIYSLSLAIYCTAWTYYGSVGSVVSSGMLFVTTFLGSILAITLWWIILRKMVRIKNTHRITSIADLISSRYGKSRALAALATVMALVGVTPYLGIQLKSVNTTFNLLTSGGSFLEGHISDLVVAMMIAFTIAFGVRRIDPTERHQGIVTAVALESVVKLAAFLAAGLAVVFVMYHGPEDLFRQFEASPLRASVSLGEAGPKSLLKWMTYLLLSMSAVMFLPRQFHVAVVENFDEKHIRQAMWLFPLYLLLINLFVAPIALAGLLRGISPALADTYVLTLPMIMGWPWLSLLVFIGGFSAATAMIVISSMTLSTMITNHLLLPLTDWFEGLIFLRRRLLASRWLAVAAVIIAANIFNKYVGEFFTLANMGLMSFAAVLQFAPVVLGGLYWRPGSRAGAILGLSGGFLAWFYTALLPAVLRSNDLGAGLLRDGPWGLSLLNPENLMGMWAFDPMVHSVFWSLFINVSLYIVGSLAWPANDEDDRVAREFVEALPTGRFGAISRHDGPPIDAENKKKLILEMLTQFLPETQAESVVKRCFGQLKLNGLKQISIVELAELHSEVERSLSGAIGAAAAHRAMKHSSVFTQEEARRLSEVYAEILADLKVTPAELKKQVDLHQEREDLLALQARELTLRVEEREREIAERKRIETALRESEARYRAVLESSPDPIVVYDIDGLANYLNPAFTRVFGWTSEEVLGRKIQFVPDGHRENTMEAIRQAYDRGYYRFESKRFTKSGEILDVNVSGAVYSNPAGKPVGMVANLQDITERKRAERALRESEERYRNLVDSITDYIYTHDQEGIITSANPAVAIGLGYEPEDIIGRPISDFIAPEERSKFKSEYLAQIKKKGCAEGLFKMNSRHQIPIYVEYRNTLVKTEGRAPYVSGSGRDVTEQIKARRDLRKMEEKLFQAQKMEAVGVLASGIAHDFNNILQAISGYVQLILSKGSHDKSTERYLTEVNRAVERAAELVRGLLTFSRKMVPNLIPLDLNNEILQTVNLLKRTIPKMISIEMILEPELKRVEADPVQLEHVLMNLATNARDAMSGGGRLLIETNNATLDQTFVLAHPDAAAGEYVHLRVSDNGQGMDEETVRHIFEPFFTTKGIGEGTGLGLSTVYGIVKTHGGHINCESQPGRGSVFNIYLPVVAWDSAQEIKEAPAKEEVRGGGEVVLLVDDEAAVREIARDTLTGFGYRTMEASSGEEALEMYRRHGEKIDLILLDLGMPGMGGRICLKELLRLNPRTRVVVASGYAGNGPDLLSEGAKGFIGKPYRLNLLLSKIREVLDEKNGETEQDKKLEGLPQDG